MVSLPSLVFVEKNTWKRKRAFRKIPRNERNKWERVYIFVHTMAFKHGHTKSNAEPKIWIHRGKGDRANHECKQQRFFRVREYDFHVRHHIQVQPIQLFSKLEVFVHTVPLLLSFNEWVAEAGGINYFYYTPEFVSVGAMFSNLESDKGHTRKQDE